jgi:hypothetical protein
MKERRMPLDTQTFPATITRGEGGEKVASGWCLVAWEMVGKHKPLDEWRGEIAIEDAETRAKLTDVDDGLHILFHPYGGVYEPWHGPVTVEPVSSEDDPNGRRLRLRGTGPLVRSRYQPEELQLGFPKLEETDGSREPGSGERDGGDA